MPPKMDLPAPWPEFLADVDQSLSTPVELHCVGGFVLTAVHGLPRPTGDLDYIAIAPSSAYQQLEGVAGIQSKLAKRYKVFFHQTGGVSDFPENYEERLVELNLGLKNLSLKILEPYDLALSKLTRNSPKDAEDVKLLAKNLGLSFGILYERFSTEMKTWLPNADRHELTLTRFWREYFAD